jgi:hypothetical protein
MEGIFPGPPPKQERQGHSLLKTGVQALVFTCEPQSSFSPLLGPQSNRRIQSASSTLKSYFSFLLFFPEARERISGSQLNGVVHCSRCWVSPECCQWPDSVAFLCSFFRFSKLRAVSPTYVAFGSHWHWNL